MPELAAVRDIVGTEQDADIPVELWSLMLSGTARPAVLSVFGQIPPQLISHAFFEVDVAIDHLLTNQHARHLKNRNLRVSPAFSSTAFFYTQFRVYGAHASLSSLDNPLVSNRSRSWG
ncbi:hypothetical protein [Leisingera sp. MMG026]|uniref:hypothetical protein n=1 Tax=Leisingera sp. MMG026 TaxID=2909982 RepID=UPI001F426364|nr:hypothetical protein [Leisingera sp. MMG026]MCF6431175.1 hypothetical protein [Leisingera sp. MMG026]